MLNKFEQYEYYDAREYDVLPDFYKVLYKRHLSDNHNLSTSQGIRSNKFGLEGEANKDLLAWAQDEAEGLTRVTRLFKVAITSRNEQIHASVTYLFSYLQDLPEATILACLPLLNDIYERCSDSVADFLNILNSVLPTPSFTIFINGLFLTKDLYSTIKTFSPIPVATRYLSCFLKILECENLVKKLTAQELVVLINHHSETQAQAVGVIQVEIKKYLPDKLIANCLNFQQEVSQVKQVIKNLRLTIDELFRITASQNIAEVVALTLIEMPEFHVVDKEARRLHTLAEEHTAVLKNILFNKLLFDKLSWCQLRSLAYKSTLLEEWPDEAAPSRIEEICGIFFAIEDKERAYLFLRNFDQDQDLIDKNDELTQTICTYISYAKLHENELIIKLLNNTRPAFSYLIITKYLDINEDNFLSIASRCPSVFLRVVNEQSLWKEVILTRERKFELAKISPMLCKAVLQDEEAEQFVEQDMLDLLRDYPHYLAEIVNCDRYFTQLYNHIFKNEEDKVWTKHEQIFQVGHLTNSEEYLSYGFYPEGRIYFISTYLTACQAYRPALNEIEERAKYFGGLKNPDLSSSASIDNAYCLWLFCAASYVNKLLLANSYLECLVDYFTCVDGKLLWEQALERLAEIEFLLNVIQPIQPGIDNRSWLELSFLDHIKEYISEQDNSIYYRLFKRFAALNDLKALAHFDAIIDKSSCVSNNDWEFVIELTHRDGNLDKTEAFRIKYAYEFACRLKENDDTCVAWTYFSMVTDRSKFICDDYLYMAVFVREIMEAEQRASYDGDKKDVETYLMEDAQCCQRINAALIYSILAALQGSYFCVVNNIRELFLYGGLPSKEVCDLLLSKPELLTGLDNCLEEPCKTQFSEWVTREKAKQREREAEQREREAAEQREREAAEQREREAAEQREREAAEQREREASKWEEAAEQARREAEQREQLNEYISPIKRFFARIIWLLTLTWAFDLFLEKQNIAEEARTELINRRYNNFEQCVNQNQQKVKEAKESWRYFFSPPSTNGKLGEILKDVLPKNRI